MPDHNRQLADRENPCYGSSEYFPMKKFALLLAVCASPGFAQLTVTPDQAVSSPALAAETTLAPSPTPTKPKPGADRQAVQVVRRTGSETVIRAVPVKPVAQASAATPEAAATPPKHKRSGFFGFFRWIFGGGSKEEAPAQPAATPQATPKGTPKATPKPKPSATPAPTAKPVATATPKPTATPVPQPSATPTPKPTATPKPMATPAPQPSATPKATATPKPSATPTPKPTTTPKPTATPAPQPSATPSAKSAPKAAVPVVLEPAVTRASLKNDYQEVKAKALQDPQIATLLQKMQAAPEGSDDYKTAARAYTGALFTKMRKLDPAQEEAFSRKEGAYQRRIEAGKPILE